MAYGCKHKSKPKIYLIEVCFLNGGCVCMPLGDTIHTVFYVSVCVYGGVYMWPS